MRKDKEESKFMEKQMTRQRIIDKQAEYLRNLKNREDEILNKQVAEAEQKANRLFEEQERRRQEMKEMIEKSRALQREKKEQEREEERRAQ